MSAEYSFSRPTQKALCLIAETMRDEDRWALWVIHRVSPLEGLQHAVKRSDLCSIAWVDGTPVTAFGVRSHAILTGTGSPWVLGSTLMAGHSKALMRYSRLVLDELSRSFTRLENYVHVRNVISIRWLKHIGFTLEPAVPYGKDRELFHHFHMRL